MFLWRISLHLPFFGRGGGGEVGEGLRSVADSGLPKFGPILLALRLWWRKACGDIPFCPTGLLFAFPSISSLLRPTWLCWATFCCAGRIGVETAYKLHSGECDMFSIYCNNSASIIRPLAKLFTMLRDLPLPIKSRQHLFSLKRISTYMVLFYLYLLFVSWVVHISHKV